jgi:hypothetical protein
LGVVFQPDWSQKALPTRGDSVRTKEAKRILMLRQINKYTLSKDGKYLIYEHEDPYGGCSHELSVYLIKRALKGLEIEKGRCLNQRPKEKGAEHET